MTQNMKNAGALLADDTQKLREALAGDLMAREWRYGVCNTVDGLADDGEWWEVCHPMPLDGTAAYIAEAYPARIARLLDAIDHLQRQVRPYRNLVAALQSERATLQKGATAATEAVETLASERAANAILTGEVEQLRAANEQLREALVHIEGAAMDIGCERRGIKLAARAALDAAPAGATGGAA